LKLQRLHIILFYLQVSCKIFYIRTETQACMPPTECYSINRLANGPATRLAWAYNHTTTPTEAFRLSDKLQRHKNHAHKIRPFASVNRPRKQTCNDSLAWKNHSILVWKTLSIS